MVVDALLQLVTAQGADALVLPPDGAPYLDTQGVQKQLSMPRLGPEMMELVLEEITSTEQRAALGDRGSLDTTYAPQGSTEFKVAVELRTGALRFTFRPAQPNSPPSLPSRPPGPSVTDGAPARVDPNPTPILMPRTATVPAHRATTITVTGDPPAAIPSEAPELEPHDVRTPTEVSPAVIRLLERAQVERASDVILSSGRVAYLRIGGELTDEPGLRVQDEDLLALVEPSMTPRSRQDFERAGNCDCALEIALAQGPQRYRANLFRQHGGLAIALRPIRQDAPTLSQLNLPDDLSQLVHHHHGLVLMTGATGSGKSTTLVALIEHLNRTSPRHVITLEDPIEYEYPPGHALIHQRQVGLHVESFAQGLKAALRETPDVIMVGEMRDRETIAAALTAAETGHLVLSTLHCGDAAMAIDRIIDAFPEHQQQQIRLQLAVSLRAVVTQVLLPSTTPPARVPAFEKLVVTTPVAAKIRDGRGHQLHSEIQKGKADGMVTFEASLARLVRQRQITKRIALAMANDSQTLGELLHSQ